MQQEGGNGGGLKGEKGGVTYVNDYYPCIGTQNGCENGSSVNSENGLFGIGAGSAPYDRGGGGGGWYGGGAAAYSGSSGGSSYFGDFRHGETKPGVNEGNGYAIIEC